MKSCVPGKLLRTLLNISLVSLLCAASVRGEYRKPQFGKSYKANSAVDQTANPQKMQQAKARLLKKLTKKLTNHKGEPVSVVIFDPMDNTTTKIGKTVASTLEATFRQYGELRIKQAKYELSSLTLEEFRTAMTRHRVDVLVVSVLKNSNFDLYIYDRRTPYYIYAHSEAIPELTQLQITEQAATFYAKLVLRRTIYRFINDQYFELPRQESAPVLQAEIPRWIASRQSLQMVNREILSRFFASVGTGAAISLGKRQKWWNSPLLAISIGYRMRERFYFELAAESSSYNAIVGSVKYVFENKRSPFRIGVSLGGAYLTTRYVWNVDETFGLGPSSYYVVPSADLLFPIGDVYLRVQMRTFIGLDEKKFLWTLGPGVVVHF